MGDCQGKNEEEVPTTRVKRIVGIPVILDPECTVRSCQGRKTEKTYCDVKESPLGYTRSRRDRAREPVGRLARQCNFKMLPELEQESHLKEDVHEDRTSSNLIPGKDRMH